MDESKERKLRDYLKRVAAELTETQQRLEHFEQRDHEPIAIVGMACRYPGGVETPEDLWDLVDGEREALSDFPDDRGWDLDSLIDTEGKTPGTTYVGQAGFLHDATDFDAAFFGISPREALGMDPQQRVMLEISWEALERAGIDPASLKRSNVGVYTGLTNSGYETPLAETPETVGGYMVSGNNGGVASGRVAYTLGLEGAAVSVDTACSSSLVAMHFAVRALRGGECDMALVGGVSILAAPDAFADFARQRGLAKDGRCKSFAAAADGTNWAEGAAVLVVERLSDAQRLGHRVLAVVRGSAINQDGLSNGLTAPNDLAQQRVIESALADARLSAREVDAVEAHGTGTSLGDPIEARALLATYGQGRDGQDPVWLGSLKSNIGHSTAAAGAGGLIKMVMAIRNAKLPKTLHVDTPSPHIAWNSGAVELLTAARPWPRADRPKRAGVSSFGISGTNAHVIVEEAPEAAGPEPDAGPHPGLWTLSAKSLAALSAQARRLADRVEADPGLRPVDIGYTLATARSQLDYRAVVLATDRATALSGLRQLAEGERSEAMLRGRAKQRTEAVFVFPGHGSQWPGMAAGLLGASPIFTAKLAECDEALSSHVDWTVTSVIRGDDGAPSIERGDVVQPALWAVTVSLAALWEHAGVTPAAVVGHSLGEVAAATVAGILSLADAAKLVTRRAEAVREVMGKGAVAVLRADEERTRELLRPWADRLCIGGHNSPRSTTVSGDVEAIDELLAHCESQGQWARRVAMDYASHSPHVETGRDFFLNSIKDIEPQAPRVPFYSSVRGEMTSELDAEYWYANLRQPVRFDLAVRALLDDDHRGFIECGPHPVLSHGIGETAAAAEVTATIVETLRRDEGTAVKFRSSVARAWVNGVNVDWPSMYAAAGARFIDLPTYPFQRERFWLRDNVSAATPKPVPAALAPAPLAAEPEAETTGDLLTMVRTEAAAALGYASAEDVEADDDFQELGFDSLAAVELRERLVDATGLTLAEEVALEYPTPVALARYLAERLGGDTGGSVPEPVSGPGAGLAGLFVRACADGQIVEANDLTLRMAAFREKYSGVSASPPRATTLTKGTAEPVLVCFPSFAWKYSPYYYAKLAASLEGGQSVIAVDLPGFAGHEPLPSTLDDLIATLADAAARAAAGRRFALLGHSEGGRLASLVAEYLEDRGEHPEAVILLDTIEWVTDIDHNETLNALYRLLVEQVDARQPTSDGEAWITARAQYLTFEFPTPRLKAPSLLMRATGRLPGWRNEDARSEVRWEHTAVDVAGDHFSMLAEHAPESARTVANWLSDSIGDQKA